MIMFDAYNTPALDPVTMTDGEGASLVADMARQCPVYVRAFLSRQGLSNVTVFWTVTSDGKVGTVFEHVRENAFNVPMTNGDLSVETVRRQIEDSTTAAGADYDGYAVGE